MKKRNCLLLAVLIAILLVVLSGCVERKLTINTDPQDAVVILNDEEIGQSPVTVSFNWYGDYNVRIEKAGFVTLKTHRLLEGPWYDKFTYDFFAQVLNPKRIVDEYEWTFELAPAEEVLRSELIESANQLKAEAKQ